MALAWSNVTAATALLTTALGGCEAPGLGRLVIVGSGPSDQVITSDDGGVTWTGRGKPFGVSGEALGVAWNGSLFVLTGYTSGFTTPLVFHSPDGITWTAASVPPVIVSAFSAGITWVEAIGSCPASWLLGALGRSPECVFSSPDGDVWTAVSTPLDGALGQPNCYGFAQDPNTGRVVALGHDFTYKTRVVYTDDLATWSIASTPSDGGDLFYKSAVWVPGALGFLASGGATAFSVDGATWTAVPTPFDGGGFSSVALDAGGVALLGGLNAAVTKSILESVGLAMWTFDTSPMDPNANVESGFVAAHVGARVYMLANSTQPISVVSAPLPDCPPNDSRFYEPPDWRFVVTNLSGATLTFLDRLAQSREVKYTLNKPATAAMSVPSDNPEVNIPDIDGDPFVAMSDRLIYGFRREGLCPESPWVCRYGGILMQANDEITVATDVPSSHLTAFDPWQYLMSQPVLNSDGTPPGKNGVSFENEHGNLIVLALLNSLVAANTIRNVTEPMPAAALSAFLSWGQSPYTEFFTGTIQTTVEVSVNFKAGTSIGEALSTLANDMGALDIILTAVYDPINQPGILCQLNIFQLAGSKKYGAVFAWDKPGRSLVGANRLLDGQQLVNIAQGYYGQGGFPAGPEQTEAASIAKFGTYWLQQFYPSLDASPGAVELLAETQLLLRQMGKVSLTVDPAPETSPVPFRDYFLGDQVPVYASNNFRQPLEPVLCGAHVTAANAPTLPVVVVTGTNDEFVYNGHTYTIAPGSYGTIDGLADAMQAATGSPTLSGILSVTVDPISGTKLKVTSLVWFSDGNALHVGTHDALVDLGFTDGQTLEGEDWCGFQRVYEIPITIPDDAPETITQILMTVPDLTST